MAMDVLKRALIYWSAVLVAITVAAGLTYVAMQQNLRQSANSPQVQRAYDAAAALESGQTPESVIPPAKVDIGRSLAPFVIVYDDSGKVVASSATLDGSTPSVPGGVLDYTASHGEDRVTWMPNSTARIATVVVRVGGEHPGFVVAGRSLQEIERTIGNTGTLIGLGWLAAAVGSLVLAYAGTWLLRPQDSGRGGR